MNELIHTNTGPRLFRDKLLTTACGLALLTATGIAGKAKAEDADRPTVWVELGGQLERMGGGEEIFAPSFLGSFDHLHFDPVLPLQRAPEYSNGAEGKVSFTPRDSDWVFSVGARYGRANRQKQVNQQLPKVPEILGKGIQGLVYHITQTNPYHINTNTQEVDRHLVLDFQVGKDVGLGLFSGRSASTFSLGVRVAQFTSARKAEMDGVPDMYVLGTNQKYGVFRSHHAYLASFEAKSSFHGVGPSLSWEASVPVVERGDDGRLNLDWGVNASALFGRQKAQGGANVTGSHFTRYIKVATLPGVTRNNHFVYHQPPINFDRARSVIVPNVGGFAGMSFRYTDLKVGVGYRADFYFGAMDGGIAERKSEDRNFYGPFATVSVGLGG